MKSSPKVEIINYFDKLVDRVDIDIEQSIEKLKEDQLLGELRYFRIKDRKFVLNDWFDFEYFNSSESSQTNNEQCSEVIKWSISSRVISNLNQIRTRTIEELRKAEEESLEYLKSKAFLDELERLKGLKDAEELKSRLFAKKFYFQVHYNPHNKEYQDLWVFNLYTFVVDFYLTPFHIKFLE